MDGQLLLITVLQERSRKNITNILKTYAIVLAKDDVNYMVNILMCLRNRCGVRDKCYRFHANPSATTQSYGAFLECNWISEYKKFWDINEDKPKNPSHKREHSNFIK